MEYGYKHGEALQRGEEIRTLQEQLNFIRRVYHGPWDNVTADGVYGRRTRNAVRAFQIFAGLSPSGNLDMMTQAALVDFFQRSQSNYNFTAPSNYSSYTAAYSDAGNLDWSDYTKSGSTIVASVTASPSIYDNLTENAFFNAWKGPVNNLMSDLDSIADSLIDTAKFVFPEVLKRVKHSAEKLKNLANEMGRMAMEGVNRGLVKLSDLEEAVKVTGKMKATQEMERKLTQTTATVLAKAPTASKVAKGFGFAAIGSQFLVVIYYGLAWYTCTPAEYEKGRKNFVNALGSFFGSLLSSAIGKIRQIVATRIAAGFVAGTVAPGAGNLVGSIVGFAVAVIDIVLYFVTGKTIGDRLWESIEGIFDNVRYSATGRWARIDFGQLSPAQIAYLGPGGIQMTPKF